MRQERTFGGRPFTDIYPARAPDAGPESRRGSEFAVAFESLHQHFVRVPEISLLVR